jgi:hypothetical protein
MEAKNAWWGLYSQYIVMFWVCLPGKWYVGRMQQDVVGLHRRTAIRQQKRCDE